MAAITRVGNRYYAVHGKAGRRLKGQPEGGYSKASEARQYAAKVCRKVMGRSCPRIPLKQFH